MRNVFNESEFYEEDIHCERCGWKGNGYDVKIVDFYGLAKVKEVHCPECDTHLGGIENAGHRRNETPNPRWGGDPLSNQFG